jgi:hypothetical protein
VPAGQIGTVSHDEVPPSERPAEPSAPSARPALLALTGAAALVAALVVTLVVVVRHDDRPAAAVGAVYDPVSQQDPLPHPAEVLLPWARVEVGAEGPHAELPDLLGGEANVRAPEGGSFVRVDVDLPKDYLQPFVATSSLFTGETDVVLRADGREYPLNGPDGLGIDVTGPYDQGGTRWVAVEGEPTDLEVLVTVDGVTQVVDAADGSVDTGDAAALSDVPTSADLEGFQAIGCGRPRRLDDSGLTFRYPERLPCRVDLVLRTPYVDGLGWAEEGRQFLMVQVAPDNRVVSVARGGGDDAVLWDERDLRLEATLGGESALSQAYTNSLNQGALALADVDNPQQFVFDVADGQPLGDLDVTFSVDAVLGEPYLTDRETVQVRWVVPGEELA